MSPPLHRPLYLAFCRDCLGGDPEAAPCWRCRGAVLYRVDAEHEADFIFGVSQEGVTLDVGMHSTPRFLDWLREVSDT